MPPLRHHVRRIAASTLCALALAAPVAAQTIVDATDPATIMEFARGYGSALMERDDAGDPMIVGRIDGTRYAILFYGCQNAVNCTSIHLLASWANPGDFTSTQINEWNLSRNFGRAYLDDEGDPVLDYVINLDGGVTARNLDDSFDWWRIILSDFVTLLDTPQQPD